MKRPTRKHLADEVAEIITAEIKKNRWGDTLPGYRSLGTLLGVGNRAINEALAIITDNGILLPPEKGKRRRIARHPSMLKNSPERRVRIVYENKKELDYTERLIFSNFRKAMGKNWNIEDCRTRAFDLEHPEKLLDILVEQNPNCRWIFLNTSNPIARWIENSDLDIICVGGDFAGRSVRGLAVSSAENSGVILENLFQSGVQKIILPLSPFSIQSHDRLVSAIGGYFKKHHVPFNARYNVPTVDNLTPSKLKHDLERIFMITPPDAIILPCMEWYLLTLSICMEKSIRVPQDLSIALSFSDPLLEWYKPKPLSVDRPVQGFVSHLVKWARSSSRLEVKITYLKPTYVPSGSE